MEDGHHQLSRTAFAALGSLLLSPFPTHMPCWGRAFSRVWTLGLNGPPPTLGSRSFQLLALSCWSSRNLRVTSSMESCRRSQKPARSWKVGTGNAVGSCRGRRQRRGSQGGLSPSQDQRKRHPPSPSGSSARESGVRTGRQEEEKVQASPSWAETPGLARRHPHAWGHPAGSHT